MIIERYTPIKLTDIIPTATGCAECGKPAVRVLNHPGNVLAPACLACSPEGAIEVAKEF